MGIKEFRATGGNAALLKDYHRKSDSLAQWQINFLPYSEQTYAFDYQMKKTFVSDYMPRGYNCGFIYDGGSPHTIAHELGHGIAGLEHVFENSNNSGKTQNLMDYASGTQLWHFQWDAIQDPSRVWMKWSKDEIEGELIQNLAIDKYFNVKNEGWENCAFLSPNGAAIIIPDVTHVLFNEDGAVLNFIINGIKYFGVFIKETQTFYGYVSESNKDLINNQILTIETNGDLNKIRYTNIKFAQLGDTVVCVYKQPYNDTYLDCINLAKWPNTQVHKDYLGVANSKYVPNQAVIIHLRGNGCVELDNNLISGYGTDIFVNLVNKIDSLKRAELIEFCNYFSETTRKKKFAFYNEKLKDELQTGVFTQATIRYFIENKIYNRTIFDKHFLFKFDTIDFDLVFSDIDLWEGINRETYNKNSKSYHYNKGGNYSYSLDDLKKRQVYKNTQTALFTAIANFEKEGNAQPISMKDGYKEYVAHFGTNSAFIAWAQFMSSSYEDITKAYVAFYLSGEISTKILLEFLEEKIPDFMLGAGVEAAAYLIAWRITDSGNWNDFVFDVVQAGIQKAYKIDSKALTCFSNIDVKDIYKLSEFILENNNDSIDCYLRKIFIDCAVGVGLDYLFSSKAGKKFINWVHSKTVDQLYHIIIKRITFFTRPVDELRFLAKITERPNDWIERMAKVIETDNGRKAYYLLKESECNYLRISARNFELLSNMMPELVHDFSKKELLKKHLKDGYDLNLTILNFKNLDKKSINEITESAKSFKESITFDGKTYSVSDFLEKYEDNSIKYNHIYDGKYHTFVKYSEKYSKGVEYIVDPITKSVTYKYITYWSDEL